MSHPLNIGSINPLIVVPKIAAILTGGCMVHKALGIQISRKPPAPKPSMVAAWSEIGLVIVDECSLYNSSTSACVNLKIIPMLFSVASTSSPGTSSNYLR